MPAGEQSANGEKRKEKTFDNYRDAHDLSRMWPS